MLGPFCRRCWKKTNAPRHLGTEQHFKSHHVVTTSICTIHKGSLWLDRLQDHVKRIGKTVVVRLPDFAIADTLNSISEQCSPDTHYQSPHVNQEIPCLAKVEMQVDSVLQISLSEELTSEFVAVFFPHAFHVKS